MDIILSVAKKRLSAEALVKMEGQMIEVRRVIGEMWKEEIILTFFFLYFYFKNYFILMQLVTSLRGRESESYADTSEDSEDEDVDMELHNLVKRSYPRAKLNLED